MRVDYPSRKQGLSAGSGESIPSIYGSSNVISRWEVQPSNATYPIELVRRGGTFHQQFANFGIEQVVVMLRASFFAGGLFVIMLGVSTMFVDKIVLHSKEDSRNDPNFRGFYTSVNENKQHVFDPPDWAGFSLMSVGGVTILYSLALPKASHH